MTTLQSTVAAPRDNNSWRSSRSSLPRVTEQLNTSCYNGGVLHQLQASDHQKSTTIMNFAYFAFCRLVFPPDDADQFMNLENGG
ncbi:MAG: hypothetical protein GY696_37555 [Gammaproteobacteria bacterium]|nr:hypothetical protein [Gammaproteobacteria bacterium]